MSSKLDIINMALSHLGATTIRDLDEDNKKATTANLFYDSSVQFLLEAHPWNFATKRKSLEKLADDPNDQWGYSFKKPSDCLKGRWIESASTLAHTVDYRVEGQSIFTNVDPSTLIYTYLEDKPGYFPGYFVKALAYHLAAEMCIPLTNKTTRYKFLIDLYLKFFAEGQALDAQQNNENIQSDSKWVTVRNDDYNSDPPVSRD
jgi:hypothetical protein